MTVKLGNLEFDEVDYDEEADVLYLGVRGTGLPIRQEATPCGHLVRYGPGGEVIGITLVNARWLAERDGEIEIRILVGAAELASVLA